MLVTFEQAGFILNHSYQTICRMERQKELIGKKSPAGRGRWIVTSSIEQLLEKRKLEIQDCEKKLLAVIQDNEGTKAS
jgi:hypothetical protein